MSTDGGTLLAERRLACPVCRTPLETRDDELSCGGCGRSFSHVAGIPDLRLAYPDPYLSRDEDRVRALDLESRAAGLDLAGLLREHWRASGYPEALAERFVELDLGAAERARGYLDAIERARGRPLGPDDSLLEVGCGTAAVAAIAAERVGRAVATDVSLRWTVLAAHRLRQSHVIGVELVCCSAEELPFPEDSFDVVVAVDVVEHVASQEAFAAACHAVLRPGGMLFLATPNRFSLGLEPHVRLWGVGYLPRRLAPLYVRALRHRPYDHVRLLSAVGLRRLLGPRGFRVRIVPPAIAPSTTRVYRGLERRLVGTYNLARRFAPARLPLLAVGPFFHVFATKRR